MAVLCNASTGAATQYAHAVADLYLGLPAQPPAAADRSRPTAVAAAKPTGSQLASYAGTYMSDEAETVFTIALEGTELILRQRPDTRVVLRPTAAHTFAAGAGIGTITFHMTDGNVRELGVSQARVFDLRFQRQR